MAENQTPSLRAIHDCRDRACLGSDTEIFFIGGNDPTLAEPARQYCRRCPILTRCLSYALIHDVAGVWGGTTDQERAALRAEHQITDVQPVSITEHKPSTRRRPPAEPALTVPITMPVGA